MTEELPEGWDAGIREKGQGDTYTERFYHNEKDLEIEVYYDELGDDQHKVVIYKVRRNEDGDAEGSELMGNWYRGTEEEAIEKAKSLMSEISRGEKNYD